MTYLALIIALLFAMNIGGSGTAAAMGEVYGSKAAGKRAALLLVALMAAAGAALGSGEVVRTISGGIVPQDLFSPALVLIVLTAATVTLGAANLLGIPLSTSEVTVGALIGVGLAYEALLVGNVLRIVQVWIWVPLLALVLAYLAGRLLYAAPVQVRLGRLATPRVRRLAALALVGGGCCQALAAGMNNAANAIGPVAAIAPLAQGWLGLTGGLALAAGALLFGGRVLETNGRGLTDFGLGGGIVVSFAGGALVVGASLLGYPVPLTQVTTLGIIGVGLARGGLAAVNGATVQKVVRTWVLSPLLAAALSYGLVALWLGDGLQTGTGVVLLAGAAVAAVVLLLALERLGGLVARAWGYSGQPAVRQ